MPVDPDLVATSSDVPRVGKPVTPIFREGHAHVLRLERHGRHHPLRPYRSRRARLRRLLPGQRHEFGGQRRFQNRPSASRRPTIGGSGRLGPGAHVSFGFRPTCSDPTRSSTESRRVRAQARLASRIGCHLTLCYIPVLRRPELQRSVHPDGPSSSAAGPVPAAYRDPHRLRSSSARRRRDEGNTTSIHTIDAPALIAARDLRRAGFKLPGCPPLAARRRRPAGSPPLRPGIPALRRG